ncbi:TetR family transcriptional regulator C-terminal domain-containing protein [Nocardia rhamnosiphila]|uniref:TetR family transcriptional regulator C-terminal domain-containing protein n=1 Tax=Nocardia rhamnosiphila TaxID=426716 RepID=UPI0033F15750
MRAVDALPAAGQWRSAASRLDPAFGPVVRQMAADLRQVLTDAVAATGTTDPACAAAHLATLVSGLSLDAVTPHGSVDRATILTVLERRVATL